MAAFDLPINDTGLAHIFHQRDSPKMLAAMERADAASMSSAAPTIPEVDPEHLSDFVATVPPVVTRLLVETAPFVSRLRWALQVCSWKSTSYSESWLALAAFWISCLWFHFTLRYFLPLLLCLPYIAASVSSYITSSRKPSSATVESEPSTTESSLQTALADLSVIHQLLPQIPRLASFTLPPLAIARLAIALYIPYALTVFWLPTSVILALAGSFLLTWRAPWARTIRHIVLSNGWMRFLLRRTWHIVTGTTPPASSSSSLSKSSLVSDKSADPKSSTSSLLETVPPPSTLRFRFSVHENQRWWMGLDWTAALLPQERASWTSIPPALKPVPPPMAISLPPVSTIYLPLPGSKDSCMKRTATWSWGETAWGVIVRLSNSTPAERVVMALPKVDSTAAVDEHGVPVSSPTSSTGHAEGFLQRGLQRIGTVDLAGMGVGSPKSSSLVRSPSSGNGPSARGTSPEALRRRAQAASEDGGHPPSIDEGDESDEVPIAKEEEEVSLTDAEGWVYGDNKWEATAPKNGIGKFTRSRRWTRIAVLTETVEIVPISENPNRLALPTPPPPSSSTKTSSFISPPAKSTLTASPTQQLKSLPVPPSLAMTDDIPVVPAVLPTNGGPASPPASIGKDKGSGLRQRLQRAVEG
ncbi:hypothetical protein DL93DRAFT_2076433 [Clavulina sp. PMI_390]|nr:hypothetical protein DL93DRAFT_2076433 [Clavulina sp. PMI_390]